jgi:hypothetical protein
MSNGSAAVEYAALAAPAEVADDDEVAAEVEVLGAGDDEDEEEGEETAVLVVNWDSFHG